ncbi:MAG: cell division protein FtsA [Deltaproteobacteria bacterium]|nr:cell division protein FtsA [Deltaproteobacteria bacterium]MBI3295185.1 cell division protein FtsA [Deltaproteobacteria bacterium]
MSATKRGAKSSDVLVGIDFGTTKICVIVGVPTPDGIEIIGIGKQPSLGIRKGVVVNIPTTVQAIQKAIEVAELMAGVKITNAVAGIAGSHIKGFNSSGVVAIKNREVTAQDVERAIDAAKAIAIPFDREVLHVIPQEFIVNEQDGVRDPIGMSGVRLEAKVHIVTGAVSSAQNLIKCANKAGIHVSDIVLEPLASAESVLTRDEKELGVALIDIGGGTTDVAIFTRGSVVHTGVIAMGGNHITNDIAVGLRTSIQDAEGIKIRSGCAMSSLLSSDEILSVSATGRKSRDISRSVLTKIIEPRVEEILALVSQEINNSGFKHVLSSGVVITGGSSLLEGFQELSEFLLELPVRRGVPQSISGLVDSVGSPIYSTAVGLLLYAGGNHTENRFGERDENIYGKVFSRMKNWIEGVF